MIIFEPARIADYEQIQLLILEIQTSEFNIDITLDDQPDLKDIESFYRKGIGEFWVARHGEVIVGTIALIDIGAGQVAIRKMFVKDTYRGKEHGIAKKLLDVLEEYSAERVVQTILLGTTDKFLAAHRFYEKNGYNLIPEEMLPLTFPKMEVDTVFFAKEMV
ncbi:GNAT family N-acetyltransferase [Kordiimonas sp. SCSIO 12603]|uniref:GNAT family N-acetyltransferase n=1 Tax=Kordiimonas sp. SCSIO 12603 TaxID=2829596 RepID=UPI0021069109|nr:GNAT family N-acetyltransferase [Kordiimonas sp. SCSIO 12603]UTW59102.1 GNAT family N-acetyltransferase [Kordiimonas sp. SCSIO 12603]